MKASGTFAALRHRNFRLFYTGQTISLIGTWMQSVAFGWLVLELTNSSFYLGLVGALQTLPVLLFSFLGGVVADHTSKLRLLFITQAALLILALALGLLVALDIIMIWDLSLIVFLNGTVMAFDIPVRQAFIVELVGRQDLPNAITLNSTLFNATRVVGPAVGGLVIAAIGMANCFFFNAASFLAVLLALLLMSLPRVEPAPWKPFLPAWKEMCDYLWPKRELRLLLLIMTIVAILAMPYYVLLPILARDILGQQIQGYGMLYATAGLGAFLGGFTLARRLQVRPPMPSFLSGLGLFLLGLLALGLCRNYYVALFSNFLAGFGIVIILSTFNSLLQLNVPDKLRARLMSIFGLIIIGLSPVGCLVLGVVASYIGPGLAIAGGSLSAALVSVVVLLRYPELCRLNFSDHEPPEPKSGPLSNNITVSRG